MLVCVCVRVSSAMLEELGRVIINLATIVPDGMVVFFVSYAFENAVMSVWEVTQ